MFYRTFKLDVLNWPSDRSRPEQSERLACIQRGSCPSLFLLLAVHTHVFLGTIWPFNIYTSCEAWKKKNLLLASYWIRVMWLNEQRGQTLCVMCQAGFLWSGLLFPAQPGTVVVEVGGLCGFRWPVAVWEVRSLVAVGLPAYRKCPLPFPHTLTPYKCRHSFLMAHNEIHLQGCLFTGLWNTSVY